MYCNTDEFDPFMIDPDDPSNYTSEFYLVATKEDELVLMTLGLLILIQIRKRSFFLSSNYDTYRISEKDAIVDFFSSICKWSELEGLILIDCSNSVQHLSRTRLLEKMKLIINHDKDIYKLLELFLQIPIHDSSGKDYSIGTGIPHLPYLSDILLNVYLDDIDRYIDV